MDRHESVRHQLIRIETLLREHQHWGQCAPEAAAFESTQPFFLDTLTPGEWLQWVLLPRMHALLDGGHPLPEAFAVAPYYEMALENSWSGREPLIAVLAELDDLISGDNP